MSKRSVDQSVVIPLTPDEDDNNGDGVLAEFTQANLAQSGRKRQRIEIEEADSEDEDEDISNKPATSGIIEKIELTNFMCHDHFELELGPQINFIIGQNGSGKSAVLTAISVGLGAKANETNRGSSLKKLIKNGSTSSRITITFKNEGAGSYKPEIFGKRIIVQRILKTEGVNKYSIKTELNKHISSKKADLDSILAAYGITVNNPMAILTQEAAKSFIATSTDEEKYKFFMAGTKADETIKNYHKTQEELTKVKERLVQLNTDLKELKHIDTEAKVLFDKYETQDELIKMKTLFQGKFLWVQVKEKQAKIEKAIKGIEDFKEEIESAKGHIEERENQIREAESTKNTLTETAIEASRKRELKEDGIDNLRESIKAMEAERKEVEAEVKSLISDIKSDIEKIPRLTKQAKDEQRRIDMINGGSHDQLDLEKQNLQKVIEDGHKKMSDLERERMAIKDNSVDRSQSLRQEIAAESRTKASLEKQLHQLKNSEVRRLDVFGKNIYRILDEIEKDSGYHRKPIGPLGSYVNLKQGEDQWSNLLESTLSKTLGSFIVEDQHDFHRLSNLFRRAQYKAAIVTKRYEVFDFGGRSASPQFKRISDVLVIENPFVQCLLVDLNNINRIVLESERQSAERILRSNANNLNSVLVPYDSRSGNALKMNRYGGLQIDVIHFRNDFGKLGSEGSSEAQINRLQQNIAKSTRVIHTMESEFRNLKSEQNSAEADLSRRMNELKKLISRSEREINDIRNKLDETANTGKLEALNDQISAIERENEIRQQAKIDCEMKVVEITRKVQAKLEVYRTAITEIRLAKEAEKRSNDQISSIQNKIDTCMKEIRHYQNSIEKREKYIKDLSAYIEGASVVVEELRQKGESCCTMAEADLKDEDTIDSIEADKEKIEKELIEFEKHVGMTREEVTIRFQKARSNYRAGQEKVVTAARLKEDLQKSLDDRLMSFEQMRIDICSKVSDSFHKALMLRQFTGEILFDFEKGKLTMMVSTKKNEKLRNIESFSGGEKSFSQISLLLAIWDFMNTKIRGLDEFDVFMDQVNRTLSLRLILEKIKNSSSQTIFITPLDIAGINGADGRNVHIHRIADPKKS